MAKIFLEVKHCLACLLSLGLGEYSARMIVQGYHIGVFHAKLLKFGVFLRHLA